MQTLNVGAGRTDEEYKAAEDHRRADLLADSRSDANSLFWAAALAALASGLFPVQVNFLVNIGGGWPTFAAPLKRVPHSFTFFAKGWVRCCQRLLDFV
jgi:hypothetical protein